MQREMRARLESLPKTEASFIEPMECLSVSKLLHLRPDKLSFRGCNFTGYRIQVP